MSIIDKYLSEIQNETSASAGLPGIDSPHSRKKPLKYYDEQNTDPEELRNNEGYSNNKLGRILIDLDRTIHSYEKSWSDGSLYGHVLSGSKEAIDKLSVDYEIVIFTSRLSQEAHPLEVRKEQKRLISEWLGNNNIYFDHITADKLPGIYYIDDRAIRFEGDWKATFNFINSITTSEEKG